MKSFITVKTIVHVPIERAWKYFTEPEHVRRWNNASDDWHTPEAENDLRVGGKFRYRMEAKDGSSGFDFEGMYTTVEENKKIGYTMTGGRTVDVEFAKRGSGYEVIETFEAEEENPLEMQRSGWQSILDNFKKYVESAL